MKNHYRLMSNRYEREEEEQKIFPEKVIFLSVEGNLTEKEYFEGLSKFREKLGIHAKVNVEVLRRGKKDTNSAPRQVIELLEEYIRLREQKEEEIFEELPDSFKEKYSVDYIKEYLNHSNKLLDKRCDDFERELKKIGYDISYRKYLRKYNSDLDKFAVLIDRDERTHSIADMKSYITHCNAKNYGCYIANPCFEFWLLMHLSDIKMEFRDELDLIKKNEKISSHHTFVSKVLSEKAHHGKRGIKFEKFYLPNLDRALEQSKSFATEIMKKELEKNKEKSVLVSDEDILVDHIGCNLWKLIEELREYK